VGFIFMMSGSKHHIHLSKCSNHAVEMAVF
jgi:hypothetical protein